MHTGDTGGFTEEREGRTNLSVRDCPTRLLETPRAFPLNRAVRALFLILAVCLSLLGGKAAARFTKALPPTESGWFSPRTRSAVSAPHDARTFVYDKQMLLTETHATGDEWAGAVTWLRDHQGRPEVLQVNSGTKTRRFELGYFAGTQVGSVITRVGESGPALNTKEAEVSFHLVKWKRLGSDKTSAVFWRNHQGIRGS